MFKKIGRPNERERDGEQLVRGEVRTHITFMWAWYMVPQNNYNSNKDH